MAFNIILISKSDKFIKNFLALNLKITYQFNSLDNFLAFKHPQLQYEIFIDDVGSFTKQEIFLIIEKAQLLENSSLYYCFSNFTLDLVDLSIGNLILRHFTGIINKNHWHSDFYQSQLLKELDLKYYSSNFVSRIIDLNNRQYQKKQELLIKAEENLNDILEKKYNRLQDDNKKLIQTKDRSTLFNKILIFIIIVISVICVILLLQK